MTTMEPAALGLTQLADEALVELARTGRQDAFAELMRRNANASQKLAVSILRDLADAEDAVQDAWFKAWQHVGNFQGDSKFSTWFTRIVVNQCLMRLRSLRRRPVVSLDEAESNPGKPAIVVPDRQPSPEDSLAGIQMRDLVRGEIRLLPSLLREPLMLRDLHGKSVEDVARLLDISVPAVKSRLLRARAELRKRMSRHGIPGAAAD